MKRTTIAIGVTIVALIAVALTFIGMVTSSGGSTEPTSLSGVWKTDGKPAMTATVGDASIQIMWEPGEAEDGVQALYWQGDFDASKVSNGWILSTGDTETMATSLFASQDESKAFLVKDGTIQFKLTALGTTKNIVLRR